MLVCVYCLECFVKDWVVDVSVCIDCLECFVNDRVVVVQVLTGVFCQRSGG